MDNVNPAVQEKSERCADFKIIDGVLETVSADTVYELIKDIKDPEHPYSLEQLGVVRREMVAVGEIEGNIEDEKEMPVCTLGLPIPQITVTFRPTVPHCSMAGIIGLSIIYQIQRYTAGFWIRVFIEEGTHNTSAALNKQLNDRERVLAAFENDSLLDVLNSCISPSDCLE
ncbi:hypothetical protein PAPHI01_0536 [Pancytospora philotis]|nr:hypothetical protein PAPHI01_0536 [Pancytospora philotis]